MKKENILVIVLICMAVAGVVIYNQSDRRVSGESGAVVPFAQEIKGSTGIAWQPYEEGLAMAKRLNKHVVLYFSADWCTYCAKLEATTFKDKQVQAYLSDYFVSISVDTDKNTALMEQWKVRGLPTIWFLKPDNSKIDSLPGYVDSDYFLKVLRYIQSGNYEKMNFNEFMQTL